MAYTTLKAAIIAAIKNNDNEEITGDILQGVLLSIVNSVGSGYNFAGVATPSTNPGTPDGSMFWIGGKGTYANFGNTITVPAGFLGLFMWDGSSFSRQAIKLSGGDGIFDITDYTGNSYANLSAALAAIPLEVKAGGMTIRFVSSPDNKYVQYRYMGTAISGTPNPFLDTLNWQGVDNQLTLGNHNLVENNAVSKEIGVNVELPIRDGYVWNGVTGGDMQYPGFSSAKYGYAEGGACESDVHIDQYIFWHESTILGNGSSYGDAPAGTTIFACNFFGATGPSYIRFTSGGIIKEISDIKEALQADKGDIEQLQSNVADLQFEKENKRQALFVNEPSTDIMKNVNNAILELYCPDYVQGKTFLNSVRKLQDIDGTVYTTINIDIFDNVGGYQQYGFLSTDVNYNFGDGVQLIELSNVYQHNSAYILIDWTKIDNGTGYGIHAQVSANMIQECSNIDRCPVIKCALTESEIPDDVVTRSYLSSVLSGYLSIIAGNNSYANKENTNNILSQHTSQIGDNTQDIVDIKQNITAINSILSSLTSQLPSGAITGDNVWTGQNEFAQKVKGVGGTSDDEFVVMGQVKNTLHRNVDVADYGADPLESAASNTAAINNALSGGNKTVTITKPGIYLLNAPILIDDNTELICSKGVVLKKATHYNYVIRNIGAATRSQNSNIILSGITIDCDYKYTNEVPLSSPLYGAVGQILMFHVNNVRMCNISITNAYTHAIQLCAFYNIVIDGFNISTNGDGVHVNHGGHLVCKNGVISSGDDSCPLNASDWLESCPEVGSIYDCHFENIVEDERQSQVGYFARHLVGKWVDWYDGMEIVHGDKVVSNGHVYRAFCDLSPNTFISHTEPNCSASVGTQADSGGFTWRYTNDDAIYEACVNNVTYKNIISNTGRGFIMAYYETGAVSANRIWDRSLYPTVEHANYPYVKGVVVDGLEKPSGMVLYVKSYIKYQYVLRNIRRVTSNFLQTLATTFGYISVEDCDFTNSPDIYFTGTYILLSRCIGVPVMSAMTGKINCDCNVNALPSSVAKGSLCMYNDVPYYNDGTSWVSLLT